MILTKKKAIEISIELWEWMAETGAEDKHMWEGWKKYGRMCAHCPLCEYVTRRDAAFRNCLSCPLASYSLKNCYLSAFADWTEAKTEVDRKKYAKLFLEQLRELK